MQRSAPTGGSPHITIGPKTATVVGLSIPTGVLLASEGARHPQIDDEAELGRLPAWGRATLYRAAYGRGPSPALEARVMYQRDYRLIPPQPSENPVLLKTS